ncbi:D-tagatose-bisphosphate aldolase, class II, non-catalytic subunit [Pseudoxanthomonas winnipegensis]|uniref:D-tagatose-bisphosphate aldolase, class II, non-catalytic subunit n=1 Tax=Pseudoxanthomonas winnipegensis TaxID=2480810 RepID=A0ABY1WHN5_9GAMM|nr:D-tagatose-bisphosphate aldolase, class II, non-catalytic subunit [Pseudoxanthomonas winnipegensis]TAA10588.1 D-tagatose-bisphosphate aldolase, class II, non-catalytic subunit [Pseudoxanthomonas winnipegensis]TAA22254.1 D-tagatose-bisphosphate aldolase, class II, non-catalytic subunit [Pseudoxanthomonas winnipegensis]TAH74606.1 D-tagatose-bisphosphate aldolase, class II, non-catalytic subunit [Pseudoxanthomonas winnipegensis]
MQVLLDLIARHTSGHAVGVTSICSAHPLVIEAALHHAQRTGQDLVLFEATCNQVNQDGGYTGMTPADFVAFVHGIAQRVGFDVSRIALGGDHLGPNPWTTLEASAAMDKAEVMVAAYVAAGFRKIHLDCSMACAGDAEPLPEAQIVQRAVRLARAAEAAWQQAGGEAPVYVIGTEVPVPGGATEAIEGLAVTTPEAALATIEAHRVAFVEAGLEAAWQRVVASVVQPGVEFDHHSVIDYAPDKAVALSRSITSVPNMVFEAHSTDYQTRDALAALVRDHFAILKVGPGLTFALREALWALDAIEREWIEPARQARLREVVLQRLHAEPGHWRRYYHGQGHALDIDLQYSLSDRIRYYWPDARIEQARLQLFDNLRRDPPPISLVSQFLPHALHALRTGTATLDPQSLAMAHVSAVLDEYHHACHDQDRS